MFQAAFDPLVKGLHSYWTPKADTVIAWTRSFVEEAGKLAGVRGTCLNFSGDAAEGTLEAQSGANLKRLATVKKQFDPGNLSRANNNILPA